jgi:hypothetical protein
MSSAAEIAPIAERSAALAGAVVRLALKVSLS